MHKELGKLELGKLYLQIGDFSAALDVLEDLKQKYIDQLNWESFSDVIPLLLRIYSERLSFEKIEEIRQLILDLQGRHNIGLTAKMHYTLGIASFYANDISKAREHFEKSLASSLENKNISDTCNALFGVVGYYLRAEQFERALEQSEKLVLLAKKGGDSQQMIASQLWKAICLRKVRRFDDCFAALEEAQKLLPKKYNGYMTINILTGTALAYFDKGDFELAQNYFKLADNLVDKDELKMKAQEISGYLKKLDSILFCKGDIVVDLRTNCVVERTKGELMFGNQILLLNLLRLFGRNPGMVFSKKDLVSKIWKQDYDPLIHDNKIYVTIKRLRLLIERNSQNPEYIKRGDGGYYFCTNKTYLEEALEVG